MNWGYVEPSGEPQLTLNYTKSLSDFLTNFCFTKGISFKSDKMYTHIVPALLDRVWSRDNSKGRTFWEIGNMGCVMPDAEALTPEGWMNLAQLRAHPDLPIATVHPETGDFAWQRMTRLNSYWYAGELHTWDGQNVQQAVTPDHDMWVRENKPYVRADGTTADPGWIKRKAGGLAALRSHGQSKLVRGGADRFHGTVPDVVIAGTREKPQYRFADLADMAEFIGWYLSEGHAEDSGRVSIAQSPTANRLNHARIVTLLTRMGFSVSVSQNNIRFSHVGVARWLREEFGELGKNKKIPGWAKEMPTELLLCMLESMRLGDGSQKLTPRGSWRYSTTSGRLADDTQELAAKVGWSSFRRLERRPNPKHNDIYRVHLSPVGEHQLLNYSSRQYEGEVWCPSVPNSLWIMRYNGAVSVTGNSIFGDVFVKVTYEPGWTDPLGFRQPPRVRIIPLNPSFCFPRWHPHDKERLEEFKLKYRFWSCVDSQTEALTRHGWKRYCDLTETDELLALHPGTDEISWQPVQSVQVHHDYPGHMVRWNVSGVDALTTPNHRWLAERQHGHGIGGVPGKEHVSDTLRYEREIVRTEFGIDGDAPVADLRKGSRVIVSGGVPMAFASAPKWSDELVETVGWYVTEGLDHWNQTGFHTIRLAQSARKNPGNVSELRRLMRYWQAEGATFNERKQKPDGVIEWYLGKGVNAVLETAAPGKQLTPEFLCSLTYSQARMLREVLIDGDGYRGTPSHRTIRWTQLDEGRRDGYQMLCAMLGIRSATTNCGEKIQEYQRPYVNAETIGQHAYRVQNEDGIVWCPVVDGGIWCARRNGSTYWTGNTAPDGTRLTNTYVEIITDTTIREYVNDELISERENPVGIIPVVHIANAPAQGSPWGLSDIWEILGTNREFNEKATEVSDIINYHANPITVITGGKAPAMDVGPNKVWGVDNENAKVYNLENNFQGLQAAVGYLQMLKTYMFEAMGVPEGALGQEQAISNTSGVALSIQFMPTMQKFNQKNITYGEGFKSVCGLALRTLFIFEPECLLYDPETDGIIQPGQPEIADRSDPVLYDVDVDWAPPLPVDILIKLEEIQLKLALRLESRKGALKDLGEEFPDEKLLELAQELIEDAKDQAAIDLIKAHVAAVLAELTGMVPEGAEPVDQDPVKNADGTTSPPPKPPAMQQAAGISLPALDISALTGSDDTRNIMAEIVTRAYGYKQQARRDIDKSAVQ